MNNKSKVIIIILLIINLFIFSVSYVFEALFSYEINNNQFGYLRWVDYLTYLILVSFIIFSFIKSKKVFTKLLLLLGTLELVFGTIILFRYSAFIYTFASVLSTIGFTNTVTWFDSYSGGLMVIFSGMGQFFIGIAILIFRSYYHKNVSNLY